MARKTLKPARLMLLASFVLLLSVSAAYGQTTISNIDQRGGWDHCTSCAGGGESAVYWMKQGQSSPSVDGKSTQFFVGGSVPFSHGLWWNRLSSTDSSKSHFVYEIAVYMKEPGKSLGLEFAANQAYGGKRWKFSTQCSYNKGYISIWDAVNKKWSGTSVPCTRPKAYTWTYYKFEYKRESGYSKWVAITINGKKYYINRSMKPEYYSNNGMNIHYQMNGNSTQADYSTWADKIKLTYW